MFQKHTYLVQKRILIWEVYFLNTSALSVKKECFGQQRFDLICFDTICAEKLLMILCHFILSNSFLEIRDYSVLVHILNQTENHIIATDFLLKFNDPVTFKTLP